MRLNSFRLAMVWLIVIMSVIALCAGCGGGGVGHVAAPVKAKNFAWGECPARNHLECTTDADGVQSCNCVPDCTDPNGCP